MTKIYINIEAEHPDDIRSTLEGLLGLGSAGVILPIGSGEQQTGSGTSTSSVSHLSHAKTATPQRERGKPAPGNARRTKAEIAEDEEADRADAARAAAAAETGAVVADRQISTSPEDRHDPDNPDDVAQDATDEAAETAAVKEASGKKLTHDDVRNALGKYVKAYGMENAQIDGPAVITLMFGEGKVKVSDVPDTQEDLAKAVAGIEEMTRKNPYNRKADL